MGATPDRAPAGTPVPGAGEPLPERRIPQPESGRLPSWVVGFGAALVVLALVGAAGVQELRSLGVASSTARRSSAVIDGLGRLRSTVIQASSAQRGALLAGTDSGFVAARNASGGMLEALSQLDSLLGTSSPSRPRLDSLSTLVRRRVAAIEGVIAAREQGDFAAARTAWLEQRGPLQQAGIDALISDMRTVEGTAERQASAAVRDGIRRSLVFLVLGALMGLALVAAAMVALRRSWREVQRARARLEVALATESRSLAGARADVHEREERYRQLVESLPQVIWTSEPDGLCSFISPQWTEFTGREVTDQLGEAWVATLHPEDREPYWRAWEKALATGTALQEAVRLRRHDGVYHWFETHAIPQKDRDGRVMRWYGVTTDVQETRDLEAALREGEERLRRIAEAAPVVLCSFRREPDGRVTFPYAAPSIEALYGVTPAELAQDASAVQRNVHPGDASRVRAVVDASAATMEPWHAEYRYLHPSRGEVWVEGHLSPKRDPDGAIVWYGVLMDITARKQVEAQRDLWATAFTHCGHGIALGDPKTGRILACNAAFGAVLHRSAEDIATSPIPSLYAPELRPELLTRIAEADRTGFCRYESEMLRGDGSRVPVQVDLASTREPGGEVGFRVATIQDITERLRASRELERRAEELERSNRDLEQFAYIASHDLQEPLRAVAGCVQLLKKRYAGQLDARADEYIGYAVDGSVRMQKLIDDLLNYSRVGRSEGARQVTDTAELLTRALQNLTAPMQEAGAVVTHDPMPVLSVYASQLSSVFQNLLSNAIKFREAGRHPVIHVGATRHGASWEFSVRDNGIGIAPEYTDRIFGIFQRLHTRSEYPGTGMGLAMCKRIVERHGGRIWVESSAGQGATFHFTIPDEP